MSLSTSATAVFPFISPDFYLILYNESRHWGDKALHSLIDVKNHPANKKTITLVFLSYLLKSVVTFKNTASTDKDYISLKKRKKKK